MKQSLGFQTPKREEVFVPQKHTDQTQFTPGSMTGRLGLVRRNNFYHPKNPWDVMGCQVATCLEALFNGVSRLEGLGFP